VGSQPPRRTSLAAAGRRLRGVVPPREYLINKLVAKLPWTETRVAGYALLGVRFEDRRTSAVLMSTDVHAPREISVGSHTIIGRHCLLDGRGGLTIGRNVNISSYSLLITAGHDPYARDFRGYQRPVVVEDDVWIATGVTVLCGVTIGRGAVVAAGALVNSDVAPFEVVAGVPAKPVGRRPEDLDYELDYRRNYI
jgi:acetyltransferase-like isoleucine patch superfamily enzyme